MGAHDGTEFTLVFDLVKPGRNSNANPRYVAVGAVITQVSRSSNGDHDTETVTISFGKVVMGDNLDGPNVFDHLPPDVVGYDLAHRAI
jgi:hypothetical protein